MTTLEYDALRGPAAIAIDSSMGGPSSHATGWGWNCAGFGLAPFGDLFDASDANCDGYSFGSGAASRGVRAKPTETWSTPPLAARTWEVEAVECDATNRAGCVED